MMNLRLPDTKEKERKEPKEDISRPASELNSLVPPDRPRTTYSTTPTPPLSSAKDSMTNTTALTPITTATSTLIAPPVEHITSHQLHELREFANSVYLTYFIRGGELSAPLELNIGDELITRVVKDLKVEHTKEGPRCMFQYTPELKHIFDVAETEALRLLYDNVYRQWCHKIQMDDILDNQARLKNLQSGDLLPFQPGQEEDEDEYRGGGSRSVSRSASGFDSTLVILPKGGGGVSTRKKKPTPHTPSREPLDPTLEHSSGPRDRDVSVSAQHGELSRQNYSVAPTELENSEILHVGIDLGATFKVLRKEGPVSPSLVEGSVVVVLAYPLS
jgi:hypothetical protein